MGCILSDISNATTMLPMLGVGADGLHCCEREEDAMVQSKALTAMGDAV